MTDRPLTTNERAIRLLERIHWNGPSNDTLFDEQVINSDWMRERNALLESIEKQQPDEPAADLFSCPEAESGDCRTDHCARCRHCAYHCTCTATTKEPKHG